MEQQREAIRRIMVAVNCIDGAYYLLARRQSLKWNTLALLYALDGGKPLSQKQICEEWLIPKSTINTVLKECEAQGLVTLQAIPGQKRECRICLTEAGKAFARDSLGELYRAEEQALSQTLQHCSPEFIDALEEFSLHLKQRLETPPDPREENEKT
ncbi:MAG: helix-turn-helix domain-containing protein [Oscillospiraceae bacterium]|nr:helix-turn-helix domain-containing protein [Oscillospiraceae bacterium]